MAANKSSVVIAIVNIGNPVRAEGLLQQSEVEFWMQDGANCQLDF
jgi:hypothetical protein